MRHPTTQNRRSRLRYLHTSGHYRAPAVVHSRGALGGGRQSNIAGTRLRALRGFSQPIAESAIGSEPTRVELVEACREVYRSNPIARRMINAQVENCVGIGYRTIPMSNDADWNRIAREYLQHRTKDSEFSASGLPGYSEWGMQKLLCFHHFREGGAFFYRSSRGAQIFEELQCRTPMDRQNDPTCRDGFQFYPDGRLQGFWIGPYTKDGWLNESDMSLIPAYMEDTRFQVRLAVTSYIRAAGFASGFRGSPPLAPSLDDLERLGDYYDAITERACVEAMVTGALFSDDPNAHKSFDVKRSDTDGNATVNEIYDRPVNMEAAAIYRFASDDKFQINDITSPGNNFEPFVNQSIRIIAAPFSMPIEIAMLNFKGVNFSASKAAIEQYHTACRMTHRYYGESYNAANYDMMIYEGMRDGDLPEIDDWRRSAIIPPGWRGLDDAKDTKAALQRVEGGLTTHTLEQATRDGRSPEDNITDIINELEAIERMAARTGRDPNELKALFYGNPLGTAKWNDVMGDDDDDGDDDPPGGQSNE